MLLRQLWTSLPTASRHRSNDGRLALRHRGGGAARRRAVLALRVVDPALGRDGLGRLDVVRQHLGARARLEVAAPGERHLSGVGDNVVPQADAQVQVDRGARDVRHVELANVVDRLEVVRDLRAAAGGDARISADANQGYEREDAIKFAQGAVQAGLDFMEQLVSGADLSGMAACAQASSVPLGADEGFHSMRDIRDHKEWRAASGGSLKTIKFGGAQAVMDASRLMRDLDMHVNLAGKLAETSIASAAIAHLAVAVPRLDWDASVTNQYLADDLVMDPVEIVDGRVRPNDVPGLGIDLSEEKLAKYALNQ